MEGPVSRGIDFVGFKGPFTDTVVGVGTSEEIVTGSWGRGSVGGGKVRAGVSLVVADKPLVVIGRGSPLWGPESLDSGNITFVGRL